MKKLGFRFGSVAKKFLLEMVIYGALVVVYILLVLRFLADPLAALFSNDLLLYAVVALLLVVAQGILLEAITSFIIGRLGLARFE